MLGTLSSLISSQGDDEYAYLEWNWSAAGDDYLLAVNYTVENWDDPDIPDDIDEESREKMIGSIVDSFGEMFGIDTKDTDWYNTNYYDDWEDWDDGDVYYFDEDGMINGASADGECVETEIVVSNG